MSSGQTATETLPSAIDEFERIRQRIEGKCVAVFVDYDGTLTPIVAHPDEAVLSDEMRATLKELAGYCPVAIISGRDLEDVRSQVGIDEVFYAGSHGFDLAGPGGWRSEHELGAEYRSALDEAGRALKERVSVSGAWVETKKFAIAVHYRQASDGDVPAVEAAVDAVAAGQTLLRKTEGKKVFELRPDVGWDKGEVVLWLLRELGLEQAGALPVYIGDDVTDEDAFEALKERGIGIVVRETAAASGAPTAATGSARFALDDADQVQEFLDLVAGALA